MTETALVPIVEAVRVDLGVIRANHPAQVVALATEAADALAKVIKAKKLFSSIQGKEYVRVEGWTTLATMMGCLPREVTMTRDEKGTYTATVELVRMSDGAVLTRASAECGMDEPTWKTRADYARRSMAATRAVSKACRLAFSWVMVLAGYEATPSEEIPNEERGGTSTAPSARGVTKVGAAASRAKSAPMPPIPTESLNEMPAALKEPDPMPWEPLKWKNKLLTDFTSDDLTKLREFCETKDPAKYAAYLTGIETILESRRGE